MYTLRRAACWLLDWFELNWRYLRGKAGDVREERIRCGKCGRLVSVLRWCAICRTCGKCCQSRDELKRKAGGDA